MRGPGTQTTNAHPFAIVCIPFGGWRALEELSAMGLTTQVDDVEDRVRFLMGLLDPLGGAVAGRRLPLVLGRGRHAANLRPRDHKHPV